MNKKNLITIVTLVLTAQLTAQTNAFQKTTWKIESTSSDGKTILKKAKKLNLPYEQSKFHFIQFEDDRKFQTGTFCFQMNGLYNISEDNTIEFSEGVTGMSSDCEEPKSLIGNYSFTIKQDSIELIPIPKTVNEEPIPKNINEATETETIEAAVENIMKTIEASQKATTKKKKSNKK